MGFKHHVRPSAGRAIIRGTAITMKYALVAAWIAVAGLPSNRFLDDAVVANTTTAISIAAAYRLHLAYLRCSRY